ncbi:MAG: glycosyltransferase family 39 protein [Solirubrobacteraceae bacterium]|nr:glycosyltransferase family 39 protein [Solirubrobacteraceae bacterium]
MRAFGAGLVRRPELLVLLALAAFLNLWNLSVNGEANTYYSAAVRSMSESWSAFLWGTFDPAGLMTVDKPPLALWVQAASVRLFGFSSWAYLAPQALMGIAAVELTYGMTRRVFGRAGGFAAGLVLALTPTAVAIFRHNNPDAALVLCITLAVWALVRGLEDGRTRWLVLAGVAVGLGFEAKMAAALLVVPAMVAAWLWVRPAGASLLRAVRQLFAFGASALVFGLAWPIAVWLTPAADRPWISGTSDNSIWSLILGYNGLGRLLGQSGGPGGGMGGGPGGGGGGGVFGGDAGPLRLLNSSLGSQGGWLLGAAIGASVLILAASRLRRSDARTGWLIAIGGAFAITAVAFSYASGIFHPYYVSALAPFTAALVGGGVGTMLTLARREADADAASRLAAVDSGVAPVGSAAAAGAAAGRSAAGAVARGDSDGAARTSAAAAGGARAAAASDTDGARAVPAAAFAGPAGHVPAELWADRDGDPMVAGAAEAQASAQHQSAAYRAGAATQVRATGLDVPAAAASGVRSREGLVLGVLGGAMLVAGAITEGVVLGNATQLGWLTPFLYAGTIVAAVAFVAVRSRRIRVAAVTAATALLLVAPAVWSAQTLNHNVGSTFPTGGPAGQGGGMGGGPGGGRGGFGRGNGFRGGFGGGQPPALPGSASSGSSGFPGMPGGTSSSGIQSGFPGRPGAAGGASQSGSSTSGSSQGGSSSAAGTRRSFRGGGGMGAGGMFGGDQSSVNSALAYAKANGGGTVVVSGQMGAATAILSSDADLAGIGGFSGRESEVSVSWFADRVASGNIRWVVTSSGGLRDSRTGSNTVMNAVTNTCTAVSSVDGLYDCQGKDTALRAASS